MPRNSRKRSKQEVDNDDEALSAKRPNRDEEDDEVAKAAGVKEEVDGNEEELSQEQDDSTGDASKKTEDEGGEIISQKEEDTEEGAEEYAVGMKKSDEEMAEEDEPTGDNNDEDDQPMEEAENKEEEAEEGNEEGDGGRPFRPINAEGKPAECGIILKVYCENFMCHPKLTVNLCRNVNFIHGQNGSGKSAILAAIQICLGSNAKRTGRARNLKGLVRKEAAGRNPNTYAKVRVTILNGGADAYKPDEYGDRITVERTISLSGGYNGFKLFNSDDKEVSRNKKDLHDMLDNLNIQVDNPVAILSQEDAKKFLGGKPEDKYAFFTKATELERLDNTFARILEQKEDLEAKQATLTDSMQAKVEIVKTLAKKVEEYQAVEKFEKKLLETQVDYGWAFFNEINTSHEEEVEALNALKEKAAAKEEELTQAEEKASGANDNDEEKSIREKMDELRKEAESQTALKRSLEADLKIAHAPVKKLQRSLKSLAAEKATHVQNVNRAKKRLKDARDEMLAKAGSAESETARRAAELNEIEEALTNAKAKQDKIYEEITVSQQQYQEGLPAVDQAKAQSQRKKHELDRAKQALDGLRNSSSSDSASIWGSKCSQMKRMVEEYTRKRRFRGQVIGPIGCYLKLAPGKEKYASLAETCIGNNTLDRFIATDESDVRTLDSIRQQLKCHPRECGVLRMKVSPRYDVPQPPADQVETVASVLVIENDIVFNTLVDQLSIDRRALAPSKEISEQALLVSNPNGRYSIKGIINECIFLPKGDRWSVRDGQLSMMSNERNLREARIGVDVTSAIEEHQKEVKALNDELQDLRAAESELFKESNRLKKLWNEKQREKRRNEDETNDLEERKERLQHEISTTVDSAIDTTELEEDVAKAEEALEGAKEKESGTRKEIEEKEPGVQDLKTRLEEIQTRNEKVLNDMRKADEELELCLNRITQSQNALQKRREKVQRYRDATKKKEDSVAGLAEERAEALRRVRSIALQQSRKEKREKEGDGEEADNSQKTSQTFTDEELEQVPIVEVPKDAKYYEVKIKRLQEKIAKELERRQLANEDPTEAIEKHSKAKLDLKATQDTVEQAERTLEILRRDIKNRRHRFELLRAHLSKMTDSRFDGLLRLNGSSGQLEFDDDAKTLDLVVQKNANDPNSQTKDVKALSGGERSFTTISLLLALGESLETPFRILDEFDVFLDTQARKLAIKTLIHIAKKLNHRQFIFITPQDLSSVEPDPCLKIFKLRNPRGKDIAGGLTQSHLS